VASAVQVVYGCELIEALHEGPHSLIHRCRRVTDGAQLVLKQAPPAVSAGERNQALVRERDVLRRLESCAAVIGLRGFGVEGSRVALLLEDFGAESLASSGIAGTLSSQDWLGLARRLTALLVELHARSVVHGELSSANIVLDPSRRLIKLIDFASARMLDESALVPSAWVTHRSPAYVSPEQTGRLDRAVDPRSDLYSLGVVLFELLTGRLPFPYTAPRELVHAHLAREPPRASDFVVGLPQAWSVILERLLAKNPDERYPTASALEAELDALTPGVSVHSPSSPPSLSPRNRGSYGQEAELDRLNRALRAAHDRAQAVVLVGAAGSGKSTLAASFALGEARDGLFAAGRFAPAAPTVPHEALSQVVASLTAKLLAEGPTRLSAWKKELAVSLGGTHRVLCEFCPAFKHLLPDDSTWRVSAGETRTQLVQAIIALLEQAAVLRRTPLCIFVDDVHFATGDSLELLLDVVAGCRRLPLLFLFAQRPDEAVGQAHAWAAQLSRAGLPTERLELRPLAEASVAQIIREHFPSAVQVADSLARIVVARTRGNPFFVRAFLNSLHAEALFDDSVTNGDQLNRVGVTANVAEFLIDSLSRLPEETRRVLAVAACIGSSFEIELLEACVDGRAETALASAISVEVVLPVANESGAVGAASARRKYQFAHELLRQAVLSDVLVATKEANHLRIGRTLLDFYRYPELDNKVFEVARHLNAARRLVVGSRQRAEVAGLNLQASRAALKRAAASEALEFARSGVELLEESVWRERYELARDLYLAACESAFECADHDVLDRLAPELLEHVRSPVEAARVHWLQGRVHQKAGRSVQAIQTFCMALARLGVTLELDPSPEQIAEERERTRLLLAEHPLEALIQLPHATDETHVMAAELLSKLVFFAYSDVNKMLPLIICRLVRLAFEHGTTNESANGFTFYGLLLALDGDRQGAFHQAHVALQLARQFGDATQLSQTYLYASYLLLHWRMPSADLIEPLGDAYRYALASGNPQNTACSATTLCICRFWAGHELTRLASDMEDYRKVIARFRQERILNWHEIWMQAIENLRGSVRSPAELSGAFYDEATRYAEHVERGDKTSIFNLNVARTVVAFLFGDYETALVYSERNRRIPPLFSSSTWAVPLLFMDALSVIACSDTASEPERPKLLDQARKATAQLAAFSADNPREIEAKHCLLQAELARASGDADSARQHYERATELAAGSGSPFEEALSSERAGRFEFGAKAMPAARRYLRTAHRAYLRWGAAAKARGLEREYPEMFLGTSSSKSTSPWLEAGEPSDFDMYDMLTCLEASRVWSSELDLGRLLEKIVTLLLETAGAQTGCLLMKRGEHWVIEFAQSAQGGTISCLEGLAPSAVLLRGIGAPDDGVVNYVASTGEPVVLQDDPAANVLPTTLSTSWRGEGAVSCFAIRRRGETLAVVYLENRLTRGIFTKRVLRVLEMLSAQAAVTLENALLHAQIEDRVVARTRELGSKNSELEAELQRVTDTQRRMFSHEELSGLASIADGLAHEIKNPLNFIANFAEGAVETVEELVREVEAEIARFRPEKQQTLRDLASDLRLACTKVVEHSNRANGIVNRMGAQGKSGYHFECTDLNELVTEALGVTNPRQLGQNDSKLRFVTELSARPVHAWVVAQDMVRVIVNLITNAVYAVEQKNQARPDRYDPEVKISTRVVGETVELSVRDNGIGVPETDRASIFLRSFTTKPAGQGKGLGLWISRDIVVRGHGGLLSLDTKAGEYAEFVVTLPVAVPASAGGFTASYLGRSHRDQS